jgi:hypothetical protein
LENASFSCSNGTVNWWPDTGGTIISQTATQVKIRWECSNRTQSGTYSYGLSYEADNCSGPYHVIAEETFFPVYFPPPSCVPNATQIAPNQIRLCCLEPYRAYHVRTGTPLSLKKIVTLTNRTDCSIYDAPITDPPITNWCVQDTQTLACIN